MKFQRVRLHGAAVHAGMMGHQTISPPGFEVGRRHAEPAVRRGRRFLLIAVVLSVCAHLLAALLIVTLPRVLPKEARPQEQGAVELLMVEQKGNQASQAAQPNPHQPPPTPPEKAQPPKPPENAEPPKAKEPADEPVKPPQETQPLPPTPVPGDEPAPPPAEHPEPPKAEPKPQTEQSEPTATKPDAQPDPRPTTPPPQPPSPAQTAAQPAPPQSQEAPVFDLSGTDSESNAIVLGGHVIPALKDDRFRNRPPDYPIVAQERGEHGTVTLLIHVSENGTTTGVDVVESSGFDLLDRAAAEGVRKWHFRPAIKDGRPIPFDMPFQVIYGPD